MDGINHYSRATFPQVLGGFMRRTPVRPSLLTLGGIILLSFLALTLKLSTRPARAQAGKAAATAPTPTEHERFATFFNGDGFKAQLLLQN